MLRRYACAQSTVRGCAPHMQCPKSRASARSAATPSRRAPGARERVAPASRSSPARERTLSMRVPHPARVLQLVPHVAPIAKNGRGLRRSNAVRTKPHAGVAPMRESTRAGVPRRRASSRVPELQRSARIEQRAFPREEVVERTGRRAAGAARPAVARAHMDALGVLDRPRAVRAARAIASSPLERKDVDGARGPRRHACNASQATVERWRMRNHIQLHYRRARSRGPTRGKAVRDR